MTLYDTYCPDLPYEHEKCKQLQFHGKRGSYINETYATNYNITTSYLLITCTKNYIIYLIK